MQKFLSLALLRWALTQLLELHCVQELLQKNNRYNIVISTYELHDYTITFRAYTRHRDVTPEKKC